MPLQSLAEYFNDRLGGEHRSCFRPFVLEDGKVSGIFGPIRIESDFLPLRQCLKPIQQVGHIAQIKVSTYEPRQLFTSEVDILLANDSVSASEFESIINFDRLCRSVHMLNYLPLAHLQGGLFLDVDPRHILGIKQDHGAYFEEIINRCGLETNKVVIVLAFSHQYSRFYLDLIKGLKNYRSRGYQLALKFNHFAEEDLKFDLIKKLSPDYLCLSARDLEHVRDSNLLVNLHELQTLMTSIGGRSILQQIDNKKSALLARKIGFDWVEGSYYEYHQSVEYKPEKVYSALACRI